MKYAYEDLSPEQFEHLVVVICHFLLGAAAQGFATGPDGGRDAKFVGTAELFPSKAAPWKGTVIVQAKHTSGYNASFSDAEFYSDHSAATVFGEELPRIRNLRASKELDFYLLFSNRKLTAHADSRLREVISKRCGLPISSVYFCGREQLALWLKQFPAAARIADIDPVDGPLLVSPDDLAEVVEHLAAHMKGAAAAIPMPADRVPYDRKNKLNNMTDEYAAELRKRHLKHTADIKTFLAAPGNERVLELYSSAAEEFQLVVIAKRKRYQTFDEVLTHLMRLLFDRDATLRAHKRLTRAVVFYMYWNCDLGLTDAVTT